MGNKGTRKDMQGAIKNDKKARGMKGKRRGIEREMKGKCRGSQGGMQGKQRTRKGKGVKGDGGE